MKYQNEHFYDYVLTHILKVMNEYLVYNKHSGQFSIYAPSFLNICHEQLDICI